MEDTERVCLCGNLNPTVCEACYAEGWEVAASASAGESAALEEVAQLRAEMEKVGNGAVDALKAAAEKMREKDKELADLKKRNCISESRRGAAMDDLARLRELLQEVQPFLFGYDQRISQSAHDLGNRIKGALE